jgi:hypothetical protein
MSFITGLEFKAWVNLGLMQGAALASRRLWS